MKKACAFFLFLLLTQLASSEMVWSKALGDVSSVAVSEAGDYVALAAGGKAYFFDKMGNLLWEFGAPARVAAISVSSTGDGIILASGSDVIALSKTGGKQWNFSAAGNASSVSVSSDGKRAAALYSDRVYVFDGAGKMLHNFSLGVLAYSLSISGAGDYVVAGSYDNYVYGCTVEGECDKYSLGTVIIGISISSDGDYIAAGSSDRRVYLFDKRGKLLWNYISGGSVNSVSVSENGAYALAGSEDGNLYLFDKMGNLLWNYSLGDRVASVALSGNAEYIAGATSSRAVFYSTGSIFEEIIAEAERLAENARQSGANVTYAQTFLSEARASLSAGKFGEVMVYVGEAKRAVSVMLENVRALAGMKVEAARAAIADVGVLSPLVASELGNANAKLSEAGRYVNSSKYDAALASATSALEIAGEAGAKARTVASVLLVVFGAMVALSLFVRLRTMLPGKKMEHQKHLIGELNELDDGVKRLKELVAEAKGYEIDVSGEQGWVNSLKLDKVRDMIVEGEFDEVERFMGRSFAYLKNASFDLAGKVEIARNWQRWSASISTMLDKYGKVREGMLVEVSQKWRSWVMQRYFWEHMSEGVVLEGDALVRIPQKPLEKERFVEFLKALSSKEVEAALIARRDGLVIASDLKPKTAEKISAMSAKLIGTAELCSAELGLAKPRSILSESGRGKVITISAGRLAVLVCLVKPDADTGFVLLAMERVAKKIAELL